MNGMILQTPSVNKDIKFIGKKGADTKSEEEGNLFENLIAKLVSQEGEGENTDFLLGKLLNLQSDFANKGKTISEFSKGDILSDESAEEIALEDLFKIALMLKNDAPAENIDNIAKELHISLDDKKVITALKEATNIKELLKIADKNGIKVKNFEFLNPEATLSLKDKKIVQKITSEEIFKMIEPKELHKTSEHPASVLTKIITKDIIQNKKITPTKTTTLTALLTKETKQKEGKQLKTETVITTKSETTKLEIKKLEIKKPETPKTKQTDVTTSTPSETKETNTTQDTFAVQKPQKSTHNTLATLLKNDAINKGQSNDIQTPNTQNKEEPLKTSESVKETEPETPIDKSTSTHDIKADVIHKTKETPDIKKTFNTFAMEFKEKVEAYKPPLMKINMQLSPGNLGDVDVTLVSRGNNLQVNINSNANTLALFVQNQAEFKNSLVNMGFSDLQMNFGDKRGEEKNQQQQQGKQKNDEYHDNEHEETNNGIEMLIPNYV